MLPAGSAACQAGGVTAVTSLGQLGELVSLLNAKNAYAGRWVRTV